MIPISPLAHTHMIGRPPAGHLAHRSVPHRRALQRNRLDVRRARRHLALQPQHAQIEAQAVRVARMHRHPAHRTRLVVRLHEQQLAGDHQQLAGRVLPEQRSRLRRFGALLEQTVGGGEHVAPRDQRAAAFHAASGAGRLLGAAQTQRDLVGGAIGGRGRAADDFGVGEQRGRRGGRGGIGAGVEGGGGRKWDGWMGTIIQVYMLIISGYQKPL